MGVDTKNMFIVWNPFQRRAQSLARLFDLDIRYYHYSWEEKGKLFKMLSYLGKFTGTLRDLFKTRPRYVFLQLAPVPVLYAAALYCAATGNRYISDCHNTMIYDSWWIKWPLAKYLLSQSHVLIVHNTDVQQHADKLLLKSMVLRDPLPVMQVPDDIDVISGLAIKTTQYIIVPCSMDEDEPILELFEAARSLPDITIVFTWFADKLPADIKDKIPHNIAFTGFLAEPEFNALYANANAAIVLTTREGTQPSGASEAISLGVPLIVSGIKTTRRLYGDAPVYVDNEPESIVNGINDALNNAETVSKKISGLRQDLIDDAAKQIDLIKEVMAG